MNILAAHWDLPNTGIFYSEDVASGYIAKFKSESLWLDRAI
jgi:hypothetical protein